MCRVGNNHEANRPLTACGVVDDAGLGSSLLLFISMEAVMHPVNELNGAEQINSETQEKNID